MSAEFASAVQSFLDRIIVRDGTIVDTWTRDAEDVFGACRLIDCSGHNREACVLVLLLDMHCRSTNRQFWLVWCGSEESQGQYYGVRVGSALVLRHTLAMCEAEMELRIFREMIPGYVDNIVGPGLWREADVLELSPEHGAPAEPDVCYERFVLSAQQSRAQRKMFFVEPNVLCLSFAQMEMFVRKYLSKVAELHYVPVCYVYGGRIAVLVYNYDCAALRKCVGISEKKHKRKRTD